MLQLYTHFCMSWYLDFGNDFYDMHLNIYVTECVFAKCSSMHNIKNFQKFIKLIMKILNNVDLFRYGKIISK